MISGRSIFSSPFFWITLLSFSVSLLFVLFGDQLGIETFKESLVRLLYGSIFFMGVVILELLYLYLTKEEERESRRAKRAAERERKRAEREREREKKSAIERLEKSFYEALKVIKKARIYEKRGGYNYELPWYLVLGGEDGEQRGILKSSGLDFPINIEYKESDNDPDTLFNWFFAEEGVFVTVPKKFVTIDRESSFHPIWRAFLGLLKKERWRRPINGIIFNINASEIMDKEEGELAEYAKVVREKLDEISKTFSSKIPVYMIVTGLERVRGADLFFTNLTEEEKREILGITFEDDLKDITPEVIESKMEKLFETLENETVDSLQKSWSKEERADIFFFLKRLETFMKRVGDFAQKSFSSTRYYAPLMLRGIYLADISGKEGDKALIEPGTPEKSGLFLPRLFERVILSERDLVKINDEYRKRFALGWAALFALLAASTVAVIYYWSSFIQQEYREMKSIEKTYREYLDLKKAAAPKITLVRKAAEPQRVMQIGKLMAANGADVNFARGDAVLTEFAKRELLKILDKIATLDETTKIKIVGYTDNIGDKASNIELSRARADSVKEFFVRHGISEDRIATDGEGPENPIASNDTEQGRSLNRRVEIYAYGLKVQPNEESYIEDYIIKDRLSDLQKTVAMLDALESMGHSKNDKIGQEVWKPGFFKIAQRDREVRRIYEESLESLLLPRVATLIEKNLLKELNDFDATQENLKAYLMLADEERRDKEFLRLYMMNRWGGGLEEPETAGLNRHFSALVELDFKPVELNEKSIFRARKKLLSQGGMAGLVYSDLKDEARKSGLKDFQFIEVLDAYPNALTGTDYRVPGFYTKEGYEKIILLKAKKIIADSLRKSWILGEEINDKIDGEIKRLHEKILGLYFIDYRRYWTKALAQLGMPYYHKSSDLTEQLELLSSSISPVVLVLRALKENTYLLTPKEKAEALMKKKRDSGVTAGEFLGSTGSKIDRLQRLGTNTMPKFAGDKMVYDLRAIFKPYHELIDDKGEPYGKMKIVLRHVEKVYQQMIDVETSVNPRKSAFEIVRKKSTSSHKRFALNSSLLPPKLLKWYNQSLNNSWDYLVRLVNGHLGRTYNDEVWSFYVERIEGRFPMNLNSESDIDLEDFKIFFQKGGLLDKFYEKYVLPFVYINEKSGKYRLKKVDGAAVRIDRGMIRSYLNAKKIQKLFFRSGSGNLYFKIRAKPKSLSPNLAFMDLIYDEKELLYEHGPVQSVDFVWPAKYPDTPAKFTLYDTKSRRVAKVRGEEAWGLLRLLAKMEKKFISPTEINIGYNDGKYSGSFSVEGPIVTVFAGNSPLKSFRLRKK